MKNLFVICLILGAALALDFKQVAPVPSAGKLVLDRAVQKHYIAAPLVEYTREYESEVDPISAAANAAVDKVLEALSNALKEQGLDPMDLPDMHEGFSYKIGFITYHGELDLTEGVLTGASEIERNDDAEINYKRRVITMEFPIKFDSMKMKYKYSAKIMGLGPRGTVEAGVSRVQVFASVSYDMKNNLIVLNELRLDRIGDIDVHFKGNPLVDWLINILSELVTTIFKGIITNVCENVIREAIEGIIDEINNGGIEH